MRTHTIDGCLRRGLKTVSGMGLAALLLLSGSTVEAHRQSEGGHDHIPGIKNTAGPRRLNRRKRDEVVRHLERLTGWRLGFDSEGKLKLVRAHSSPSGSETARQILLRTFDSIAITLEDHSLSADIAFAALKPDCVFLLPSGKKIEGYRLLLDFQDFQHLSGDREALEAFNLGFVLMHELVHALEKRHDPPQLDGLRESGDCEEIVNRIRQELHLPVRAHYSTEVFLLGPYPVPYERLRFVRARVTEGKIEQDTYVIQWPSTFVSR